MTLRFTVGVFACGLLPVGGFVGFLAHDLVPP